MKPSVRGKQTQYTTNRSTNHNVRQGVFRTNDSAAEPGRVGQELKRLGVAFPGDGHRQAIRVAQQRTKVGAEQCGQHVCGRGVGRKYNIEGSVVSTTSKGNTNRTNRLWHRQRFK
jgi:hypothetical protein